VRADVVDIPNIDIAPHVRSCMCVCLSTCASTCHAQGGSRTKKTSKSNRSAQLCDLDHQRRQRLSLRRRPAPDSTRVHVHVDCQASQVGLMKARTHGREASGRTLSVTIHCLRVRDSSRRGYWGTAAVLSLLPVPWYCIPLTIPSLLFLIYIATPFTASPIHSLFCSLLLVACRLFYFQPAALLRLLLLGVRTSAPRHSLRFAYTLSLGTAVSSWNRWSHAACIPGSFCISSLFTTTLATPKSRKHTCVTRRIRACASRISKHSFHCI
jgi:hypothetical protein